MAYPHEELTEHIQNHLWPRKPVRECDFCPAYTDTLSYQNQLRSVMWGLVKRYPERYDLLDYLQACEQVGISTV